MCQFKIFIYEAYNMKRSYTNNPDENVARKKMKIEPDTPNENRLNIVDLPMDMISILVSHLTYSQVVRLAVTHKRWYFGAYWNGLIDLTFIGERIIENISNSQLDLALSKCDPKRLRRLQLIKCDFIDGKHINRAIHNYKALNVLVLSRCSNLGNTFDILDSILKLPFLETLDLSQNTWLNDHHFSERVSKSIKQVNLNGCTKIDDDALSSLSFCCPNLESISLSGCFRVTDKGVAVIREKLPKIRQLDLSYCDNITDTTLAYLKNSQNLRDLNIANTAVSGLGIKDITMSQNVPDLSHLIISSLTKVDQDVVMQLTRFSALKMLDITRNEVVSLATIAGLVTFLPNLEMLFYSSGSIMRVADHNAIVTMRKNYLENH